MSSQSSSSSSSLILDGFTLELQKLLEQTLAKKSQELTEREEVLKRREDKVDAILKNNHVKGHVELRVGSVVYHTAADILLKVPDSYFHGLLNPNFFQDSEKSPLFVARDGESFKYVLEYLTYGRLYSFPPDDAALAKLMADADFYLLPELGKQVSEMEENRKSEIQTTSKLEIQVLEMQKQLSEMQKTSSSFAWMRVASSSAVGNGQYINWNVNQHLSNSHFSHSGNTTTVLKEGLYHVFVRYHFQCSTHGNGAANVDLYLNTSVVARSYHGENHGYQDGRTLECLTPIGANGKIQVLYYSNSNGNSVGDQYGTTLTILCVESK